MENVLTKRWEDLEMTKSPFHPNLFHKELLSSKDADGASILANCILFEKLTKDGSVLPHYHNVCEVICITKGRVQLYANGKWEEYSKYATFVVPAGVTHSVYNIYEEESEQISFFIPAQELKDKNIPFETEIFKGDELNNIMQKLKK